MSHYIVNPFFQFGGPPPPPTRNAWIEVGRTTLGSAQTTITVSSLPNKRYYMVLMSLLAEGGNTNAKLRFNGDSGNNYARSNSINGAVDNKAGNQNEVTINFGGANITNKWIYMYIDNNPNGEKLLTAHYLQQEVGSGTAPTRTESIGKWILKDIPDNVISQIQILTDGAGSQYSIGSEMVVLGFDPADGLDSTFNFWQELANVELATQADILTANFSARKYLWVQIHVKAIDGTIDTRIQFNGDVGTNYANRQSKNGGADTTTGNPATSTQPDVTIGDEPRFYEFFIVNETNEEKLGINHTVEQTGPGAGNIPQRQESVFKWINVIAQITTIDVKNQGGTGDYATGSKITVWGHD